MENVIEQVKVITAEKAEFTNQNSGEVTSYFKCQGMSHENGVFCFNVYNEEPAINDLYNMVLSHDSRLKAKINYIKAK